MKQPPFEIGAIVKLTDRYARVLSKAKGNPRNWLGRRGTVLNCNEAAVCIIWEGRKSRDYVPHKAVELAQ